MPPQYFEQLVVVPLQYFEQILVLTKCVPLQYLTPSYAPDALCYAGIASYVEDTRYASDTY